MSAPYDLYVEPALYKAQKKLPGSLRSQLKYIIANLAYEPRPHNSRELNVDGLNVPEDVELRRIRIRNRRLIYAIDESEKWVRVWGIRRRPPYDYEDLTELVKLL